MPRRRKSVLGPKTRRSRLATIRRASENDDQRNIRRTSDRVSRAAARMIRSPSPQRRAPTIQREIQSAQIRRDTLLNTETPEQQQARLVTQLSTVQNYRAQESSSQRQQRQTVERRRHHDRRKPYENMAFFYDPAKTYNLGGVGKCDNVCKFCRALKFPREADGMCCNKGQVKLEPLQPIPTELKRYMDSKKNAESKHFTENIRNYNSCFQMTSFGTKKSNGERNCFKKNPTNYGWASSFTIQGQVYHTMKSLNPTENAAPTFLQIYFTGPSQEYSLR